MNIFRDNAPLYWAAGIPAMPLKQRQKAPILAEWTTYGTTMPSAAIRDHWLETYPRSNIGLPFGPASGLCAIDIDTVDPEIVAAIEDCLPASPWKRIGAKGCALIFKWQGQRNFKIRDDSGMLCEFLGLGNQLVLPPSIHPDTGQPYVSDTNLWEVMDKIQPLGVDIEDRLRAALGVKGYSLAHDGRSKPLDVVPAGERDIQLVRHAGYLARVVLGIDKNTKFSLGEALAQMHTWVVDFTASAAGDDMDPQKGLAKLLEFLLRDIEGGRTLPEGWDAGLTEEHFAHPTIAAIRDKNQAERWTFARAKDWISGQIAQKPDDDNWALDRIAEIIEKVAADENFLDHHFDALVPALQRASGSIKLSKPALAKMFKGARQGEIEMAADHDAIARQVVEEMDRGGELRHAMGSFWQWNGSCYGEIDDKVVYDHISTRVKGNVLSKRHSDYQALVKVVANMVQKPLDECGEIGINFANGFLDADLVLHEHAPKYGKTFTMPFNYVPARRHEAHKWLAYLETSWGDDPDYDDKVKALQEAFAATMFGVAPSFQRVILLHGKSGSGKTQALEVLQAMMPPTAVCSMPPDLWSQRFAMTGMVGKTLNVCGELPEDSMISGEVFKKVVEGAQIPTEHKGQDGFEFKPFAAHWFASNHLPRSRDTSIGFIRRWLILDYNRVVPPEERQINFHRVLIDEEREAIAAWAVEGFKRLREQKDYTLPASHKLRSNQIRRSNNSVAAFLQTSERVRPAEGGQADAREVFDQYLFYQKDVSRGNGVSYERFLQMMPDLDYPVEEYMDEIGVNRSKIMGLHLRLAPLNK